MTTITRRARRAARLLACALVWIALFNLVALTGNHLGEWFALGITFAASPVVGWFTYPLFAK